MNEAAAQRSAQHRAASRLRAAAQIFFGLIPVVVRTGMRILYDDPR